MIIIGVETRAGRVLDLPAPPKNYKKPETIEQWKQQKQAELEEISAHTVTAGSLVEAVWQDINSPEAVAEQIRGEYVGLRLIRHLSEHIERLPYRPVIVGFAAYKAIRMAVWEAMANEYRPSNGWWVHQNRFVDPYKLLVPSEDRQFVTRDSLLESLGVRLNEDLSPAARELYGAVALIEQTGLTDADFLPHREQDMMEVPSIRTEEDSHAEDHSGAGTR